jgi:hypothetical protein
MESVDGWLLEVGGLRGDTGTVFRSGAIAHRRLIIRGKLGVEGVEVGVRKRVSRSSVSEGVTATR